MCVIDFRMRVYVVSEEFVERFVVEELDCVKEKVYVCLYYDVMYVCVC